MDVTLAVPVCFIPTGPGQHMVAISGARLRWRGFRIFRAGQFLGPPEGLEVRSTRVEGRHEDYQGGHPVDQQVNPSPALARGGMRGRLERQENLILAEEAGEREDAGKGQAADREGQVGVWQPVAQAPEPSHVDDVAHRVHHAAGCQEEQGFEERVREQVKHRGHHGKLRHIAHACPQAP